VGIAVLSDVPNAFSPASIMVFIAVGPALLLSTRLLLVEALQHAVSRGALEGSRAVLVGDAEELASLTLHDLRHRCGIEPVAEFVLRGPTATVLVVNDIIDAVRTRCAEQVIFALPWNDWVRIEALMKQLQVLPVPIVLLADSRAREIALKTLPCEAPPITIRLQKPALSRSEATLKRTFDIVMSSAILCLVLPVLLLAALAIRADSSGPVIFRQRRRGFNGAEFRIKKFRTMIVLEDGPTIAQTRPNDSRVTRVGRILRRTSLDELPQLLNVLGGDMSLIGPRPHAIAHDVQFSDTVLNYAYRFRIKPGITGWAQINGFRGETPQIGLIQKRIDLDIWYMSNWSLWLDLKILVLTSREVVRGRNAF
jgi:Undecaprenyl-phosphate glucose phosphotransferase